MADWLLWIETIAFGLAILLLLPMWAAVPMLFGVAEDTPVAKARPVYVALVAFPVVVIGSLLAAWFMAGDLLWLYLALPPLHVVVLLMVRVK